MVVVSLDMAKGTTLSHSSSDIFSNDNSSVFGHRSSRTWCQSINNTMGCGGGCIVGYDSSSVIIHSSSDIYGHSMAAALLVQHS